jgi:hypothetical protein
MLIGIVGETGKMGPGHQTHIKPINIGNAFNHCSHHMIMAGFRLPQPDQCVQTSQGEFHHVDTLLFARCVLDGVAHRPGRERRKI